MTEQIQEMMARNDWQGAMALTQDKLRDLPNSSKLHSLLGLCFYRSQRYEDAAREFKVALLLDDKNFDAALKLAQSLDRLMRYDDALEAAQQAHHLRPGDATVNVLINGLSRQVQPKVTEAWQKSQMSGTMSFANES